MGEIKLHSSYNLSQSPRSSNSIDLPTLLGIVQALQGALKDGCQKPQKMFQLYAGVFSTYPNHRRSHVGRSLYPPNCCYSPRLKTAFSIFLTKNQHEIHRVLWRHRTVSGYSWGCFSSTWWPARRETHHQSKSRSPFL